MGKSVNSTRRGLLKHVALGLSLVPLSLRVARAAGTPLSEKDPAAVAAQYVEDARRAKGAQPGTMCSSCGLFNAPLGATQGSCSLFPNKTVKAAGWCNMWAGL